MRSRESVCPVSMNMQPLSSKYEHATFPSTVALVEGKVTEVRSKQLIDLPEHALDNLALVKRISDDPHMCYLLHLNGRASKGGVDGIWQPSSSILSGRDHFFS